MKRLYVAKLEPAIETTRKCTPYCGFVDTNKNKGWLAYIGSSVYKPLKGVEFSYGDSSENLCSSVCDFVEHGLSLGTCISKVKTVYMFDSLKELFQWLIED